jgi:hypothetical protein
MSFYIATAVLLGGIASIAAWIYFQEKHDRKEHARHSTR